VPTSESLSRSEHNTKPDRGWRHWCLRELVICSHLVDTLFWLFAVAAVLATLASVKRGRRFVEYAESRSAQPLSEPAGGWPAVALIVPVKGAEPGLAENLRSLGRQDYPDIELMVCYADEGDAAVTIARATLGPECRFVAAGEPPPDIGEKIHNLRAAVEAVATDREVLVFADSDGQVRADWIRRLVAPLADEGVGATTAFRWHFPEEGGFWPLLRSVWDSVIPTIMDSQDRSFAWGGGTAVSRDAFRAARVLEYWQGAVSDDLRLTQALHDAGMGVRFLPEAMVATTGQCGRLDFLAWTVRQATITRVYRFKTWLGGCLSHLAYCAAQLLCVLKLVQGDLIALFPLALILLPGMAKGGPRADVCSLVFPDREAWLDRYGWAYFWLTPLATWVWLYAFLRSGLTRRIRWRGRAYDLISETRVREVGRS